MKYFYKNTKTIVESERVLNSALFTPIEEQEETPAEEPEEALAEEPEEIPVEEPEEAPAEEKPRKSTGRAAAKK